MRARGVVIDTPKLTFEEFSKRFPRYSREREKELNRLHPEGYALKSWFMAANQDKRGLVLQATIERIKGRKLDPAEIERQAASILASQEEALITAEQEAASAIEMSRLTKKRREESRRNKGTAFNGSPLPTKGVSTPLSPGRGNSYQSQDSNLSVRTDAKKSKMLKGCVRNATTFCPPSKPLAMACFTKLKKKSWASTQSTLTPPLPMAVSARLAM